MPRRKTAAELEAEDAALRARLDALEQRVAALEARPLWPVPQAPPAPSSTEPNVTITCGANS